MRMARLVFSSLLLLSLLTLIPAGLVSAQEDGIQEALELEPTYGKLEDSYPGASFEYVITLNYTGPLYKVTREFDLTVTAPQNWSASIIPYSSTETQQNLLSIRLEQNNSYPDKIKVRASPSLLTTPEPGEYTITLEAGSGDVRDSIDLVAVITANYSLGLTPTTGLLSTSATTGKENFYSVLVTNDGSGTLESIKLSSSKPSGWSVEFNPETIDELSPGSFQTIDVNIKPTAKAIAGDYQIKLVADTDQTTETITVRVTVQTPTVWGWVGIGIILLVIAGVTYIFMRFSRR